MENMTYIKRLVSRIYLVVAAVLAACSLVACSVGDDDIYSDANLSDTAAIGDGLIGKVYKSGMLMGDIDAISSVAGGRRDTVRYSDISTYITVNTMQVGNFPYKEILRYLPGAKVTSPITVSIEYGREEMPVNFNYRVDHLRMEVTPKRLEFTVDVNGGSRTVRAELAADDGKMTYEELIHWKYHFNLHLLAISVDGEPVEEYNNLDDSGKYTYVYNSWIINYNVF